MREIILMKRAELALSKVAKHIADQNHPDTGSKFIDEVIDFCIDRANLTIVYPLCKNQLLAKRNYDCLTFKKKWAIAFKLTKKEFKAYQFIYGPRLR